MANRRDGGVRMQLEREAHPPAHGRQSADRAPRLRHQDFVQGRLLGLDERVGDDFRRVTNSGVQIPTQGEAERKPRMGVAPGSRERISDETLVRYMSAAK